MKWTESQENAINDRGRSLVVSAGAGSGKTSVLAERLINMLAEKGSLDDFLVVTFTRAAAADLKDKLFEKLSERIAINVDDKRLSDQLFMLSGARISTIDSFCYEVVKHNFNILRLSPRSNIASDSEQISLLRDVIDSVLSEKLSASDPSVHALADNFCAKNGEEELALLLEKIYSRIRAYYRYDKWLEDSALFYEKELELFAESGVFATRSGEIVQRECFAFLSAKQKEAEELYSFIATHGDEANLKQPDAILKWIERLLNSCTRLDTLAAAYSEFPKGNASYKGMSEDDTEYCKKAKDTLLKSIKDKIPPIIDACSFAEEDLKHCGELAKALGNLLLEIDSHFAAAKRRRALLDYSDLEHYMMKLLEASDANGNIIPSPLCISLRNSFRQVFIDEYQDVNPLQDRIFSFLSRSDNCFVVGDVKQSIYRFRNAYPELFLAKRDACAELDEHGDSGKVFLRENFRCSRGIIEFVNLVTLFAANKIGRTTEYRDELLIYAKSPDPCADIPVTVAVAEYEKNCSDDAQTRSVNYIAAEIKKLVASGKYKYGDIAVLLSAVKGATQPFERVFRRAGIPCNVLRSDGYLSSPEVTLALSCLSAVDNPTDDVALFSMMRSPLFGFDADFLYKIRKSNSAYSLCVCLRRFAAGSHLRVKRLAAGRFKVRRSGVGKRPELRVASFLRTLDYLRDASGGTPAHRFLWELYERTGLLAAAASSDKGDKAKDNLLLLYEYAAGFERSGFKGISLFCDYINRIIELGEDLADAQTGGSADCVKIMSIHKAKGLEFPVCFLANASSKFKKTDSADFFVLDRSLGMTFGLRDTDRHTETDTLPRIAASLLTSAAMSAEELRKLYVALTRARERLYIVGKKPAGFREIRFAAATATTALDWILGAVCGSEYDYVNLYGIENPDPFSFKAAAAAETEEPVPSNLEAVFAFSYPYADASATPAKLSVSELRKGLLEEDNFQKNHKVASKTPMFIPSVAPASAAGTANHLFMQFCDMRAAAINGSRAEGERLLEKKYITEEQHALLDYKALDTFFASTLYGEMANAKNLWREKRFSLRDDGATFGRAAGEEVLVQGVIDCFFIATDGCVTVVDYKTDHVYGEAGAGELLARHSLQLRYYCRAAEKLTDKKVTRALLYSFALGKEVEMPID